MSTKVDKSGSTVPRPPLPPAIKILRPTGSNVPQQVAPARSAMDLATRALNASRSPQGGDIVQNPALTMLMQGGRRNEALMARALVGRLAKAMQAVKDPRLENMLLQFAGIEDEDELLAAIGKANLHPSAAALLLAAMAQQHYAGRKRKRLEDAVGNLIGSGEDWDLSMLGWLEFGPLTPALMAELKALYQRTDMVRQGMSQFFEQLVGVGQRRRKIKVLIRALGAELSGTDGDPAEGKRLGCIVRDLKRLLMFLGCEEQCADIARGLGEPVVEPDSVLGLLIRLIDQSWLYPDWFANEAARLRLEPVRAFKLGRCLAALLKLLPEPCFRDEAQRKQILEALAIFNEREDEMAEGDAGKTD